MKLQKQKFFNIQLLLLILVLSGCNAQPIAVTAHPTATTGAHVDANGCIAPIYPLAYPVLKHNDQLPRPGDDLVILPASPWRAEVSLPEVDGLDLRQYWQQSIVHILQTRAVKNHFEIWVRIPILSDAKKSSLAIYSTDSKKWEIIPEPEINQLIVDKNGSMWGVHAGATDVSSADTRVLSKFDEQERVFKAVEDIQNIPSGVEMNGSYNYNQVLLDGAGVFWILVPGDAIYSYDSIAGKLARRKEIPYNQVVPFTFNDAQLAPDGSIYMFIDNASYQGGQFGLTFYLIKQFFPKTNEIDVTNLNTILEPYPIPGHMLVDHSGRLWLDNAGYRDENKNWYQLQRSPLFASAIKEDVVVFEYNTAKILMESSDGRLWFLHPYNGMISLDPQKSEWCWFTTYQSNIVEDAGHNLWMIADGKLYKNPLRP